MIDLRNPELPHSIDYEGCTYELNTDFRVWIEFERSLVDDGILLFSIFKNKRPEGIGWVASVIDFLKSPNATPNNSKGPNERVIDFVLDGAYIVSSFYMAYGIDLTTCKYMHWHLFLALIEGLPEDSKMGRITESRSYRSDKRSYEAIMNERKRIWRLPNKQESADMQAAIEIAERLYNEQQGV